MKTILAACVVLLGVSGCAGFPTIQEERQTAASGFIGCPPSEIQTSDHKQYTWTASCKAQVFYCTVAPSASCQKAL